ncbi:hypothetical protein J6590_077127 [Homalodisca vitripennis]|nr:hypothetical protein J6590_077127 [Homalodisca vitripennis]
MSEVGVDDEENVANIVNEVLDDPPSSVQDYNSLKSDDERMESTSGYDSDADPEYLPSSPKPDCIGGSSDSENELSGIDALIVIGSEAIFTKIMDFDDNMKIVEFVDDFHCAECLEKYEETKSTADWIKCVKCSRWLHETCSIYSFNGKCGDCVRRELSALMFDVELNILHFGILRCWASRCETPTYEILRCWILYRFLAVGLHG